MKILVILFVLSSFNLNAQRPIIVKVVGEDIKLYTSLGVKLYNCQDTNKVIDYQACRLGIARFSINILEKCLIFEAFGSGFKTEKIIFLGSDFSKRDTITIRLNKDEIQNLLPVIVRSKSLPIIVSGDTTTYRIDKFTDGTERKLQDILAKLPGIDINSKTGEIKFKGKPITALMFDGDDLFGKNYSVGSKNLNASMIEGVQAIENFSDNYVLKDFENEENVAINILLKKIPLKVNVNFDLGGGLSDNKLHPLAKDYRVNLLGISNKFKFFNVFTHNNIGYNYSTKNYFGNNINLLQRENSVLLAKKFIPQSSFENFLDENRANLNNQTFVNVNALFHLNNKSTARVKGSVTSDKLQNKQLLSNLYFLENDTINNIDNTVSTKKPFNIDGDIYLRKAISRKILFENNFQITSESILEDKKVQTNYFPNLLIDQNSKSLFFKFQSKLSKKVGIKNALQSSLLFSNDVSRQGLELTPSVLSSPFSLSDLQSNIFDKTVLQFQNVLYGRARNITYNLSLSVNSYLNEFNSILKGDSNSQEIFKSLNKIRYEKNEFKQGFSLNYKIQRLSVIPSYSLTYLTQRLFDEFLFTSNKSKNFIIEPKLNLKYRASAKNNFTVTIANTQKSNVEEHIFTNNILQTNRLIVSNNPSLLLLNETFYLANFSYRNLFEQFEFSTEASYTKLKGDYLSKFNITDSIIYESLFFLFVKNSTLNFTTSFKKYFPNLKSSLNFSCTFSKSQYNNSLGNNIIRNNINNVAVLDLFYKSTFKSKINFVNQIVYSKNSFINGGNPSNKFLLNSLQNKFETSVKFTKSLFLKFNVDTYIANTSKSINDFNFIDLGLTFKTKSQKSEYRFTAKNLLDINYYSTFQNSDFFKGSNSISILRRYILLNVSYSF